MKNPIGALLGLLIIGWFVASTVLSIISNILLLRPAVIPLLILSNASIVIYYWLVYQILKGTYSMLGVDQTKNKKRAGVPTFFIGTAFLIYAYASGLAKQFWFFVFNGH